MHIQQCSLAGVTAMACVMLVGCGGEPRYTVEGAVQENGQPVIVEVYEEGGSCVELEFFPLDDSGGIASAVSYPAYAKKDGTFLIDGTDGAGIPPGKYRVALRLKGETVNGPEDLWQRRFEVENTPFEYDINEDQEITIDIAQASAD